MKTSFLLAAVFAAAAFPSLADLATARAVQGRSVMLVESNSPTRFGHDTAQFAESESNGPTRGGKDTAQFA